VDLAEEISKRSVSNNVTSRVLLQANVSGEESKHGFAPHELKPAIEKIIAMPGVEICGLMTMAPIEEYAGQAREVFAKTRVIYEDLKSFTGLDSWNVLSMGMSQDYKSAILEGSTHIRIGTAIFGNRAEYKPVSHCSITKSLFLLHFVIKPRFKLPSCVILPKTIEAKIKVR
jgi:pyridoxal phosphate enzyme (YggS family)